MSTTLRAKALACVSGERVRLVVVQANPGHDGYDASPFIRAEVAASQDGRPPSRVELSGDMWSCSGCPTRVHRLQLAHQCKHIGVVAMLTGHPSAAAKAHADLEATAV